MRLKNIFFIVSILLLVSCEDEDFVPRGSQLLLNPNLSLYEDSVLPWTSTIIRNQFETGVTREVFYSGNRSLFIENQDSTEFASASWSQTYTGPMPKEGSTLELMAFIKGENIKSLRADNNIFINLDILSSNGERIQSQSAINELEGDFDWYLLKVTLDNFPADAKSIGASVSLNSWVLGKAYFDEINLYVK
ncbi:hypothetical protein SAMN04487988_102330 [Algoriphagus hitonicola]|uniref:Uncharacterized protein n=2 Tax=Algoriphagus hitonicola TaxID=435880 RepID=A0A1I2QNJ5_9BACT|nr:hypothetical protein SAMN04487988_102330 [Algoriphagus hitonicola]